MNATAGLPIVLVLFVVDAMHFMPYSGMKRKD
jgi:hypothetical protein